MPDEAVKRSLLVLIVEDELFIALDLEAVVTGEGHAVLGPAASVRQARQRGQASGFLERRRPVACVSWATAATDIEQ